jgi:twinkle protein
VPALSIPNGSGKTWIEHEWDNLAAFDTIYVAFDQDAAGQKITEEVVERLGKHRCVIVAIPKKDAIDSLLAGFTAADAADWIKNAQPPKINKLITGTDILGRLLAEIREKPEPFTLPFMRRKWPDYGFWFRPGELTLWGGYSHAGKSTMLNFLISHLLIDQFRIFVGTFEVKVETMMRKLVSVFHSGEIDENKAAGFIKGCGSYMAFADVVGSISQKELLEMMWFAFRRYGCTLFFIDSLMIILGLEEDYPEQGEFCNRLQDFAKQTGCHIHLVAHLAKPNGAAERPSMYAIKGSSMLVNNADNVLLMSRNPMKDKLRKTRSLSPQEEDGMHDAEIIVEKQRETGWQGIFKLKFNPHRFTYSEFKEPENVLR